MIRATRVFANGKWPQATAVDSVVLDYDQRHRRRVVMKGERGVEFLLDLAEAFPLRHGDGLQLEDGRIVAVSAAPEPLAEIKAANTAEFLRVAWHLGNRHLPAQFQGDRIRIRRDHVIEEMVQGLGAVVTHVEAPFDPEGGAYHGDHHEAHRHHNPALDHDDRIEDEEPGRG